MSTADITTVIVGTLSVAAIGITPFVVRRVQRRKAEREARIRRITEPPRMSFADVAALDGDRRRGAVPEAPAPLHWPCGHSYTVGELHSCERTGGAS